MIFEVIAVPPFIRELKRLSKKFPSLKNDVGGLVALLTDNPTMGIPLGNHCFKIRLAITSKGKGKSGGGRVITHVHVQGQRVYLLDIFDKTERATASPQQIAALLKHIP